MNRGAKHIRTEEIREEADFLKTGDNVLLSGVVYTARDAAHKRLFELLDNNEHLPFEINNACLYYAGPTPNREGMIIGSCGPTTSGRMDKFTPRLLELGLCAMIGKGGRSDEVIRSVVKNKAVYFCALGGLGALASKCIKKCEVIAFDELGCESIKKLYIEDFPVVVAIDSNGNNIFNDKGN